MAPTRTCARGHELAFAPEAPPYRCRHCALALRDAALQTARDPRGAPLALRALATSRWLLVRAAVAANPSTPGDALAAMTADDGRVALALAGNPMLPVEAGRSLARHPSVHVRRALAANPALPLTESASLGARHPREILRNGAWRGLLAHHPKRALGGGELLLRLVMSGAAPRWLHAWAAEHGDPKTRRELASVKRLALGVALGLVRDPSPAVRARVAARRELPAAALAALARDEDDLVRAAAARNPAGAPEALGALLHDGSPRVRAALAANPSAPAEVLRSLVEEPGCREAVAANPGAPADVLDALTRMADDTLEQLVASNRRADPSLLGRMARWRFRWSWRCVPARVGGNPAAPPEALRRIAASRQYHFRMAVARNPAAPRDVLRALARDPSAGVRRHARRALASRRRRARGRSR